MLSPFNYMLAVELTQIVSIDFICRDENNKVLVGKRINEPAKGMWFVPGGKIYKNEQRQEAIRRISLNELGFSVNLNTHQDDSSKEYECVLVGVNDHIYETNFMYKKDSNDKLISTHYVCLAYEVNIRPDRLNMAQFLRQHSDAQWMTPDEIISKNDVHEYTKKYFTGEFRF